MRVLITGINGFVGGYLVEHLLAHGVSQIWGVARQSQLSLPHLAPHVQLIVGDASDQTIMTQALNIAEPEVVFHLAGQSNVPQAFADPAGTLTTNVLGTLALFQAVLATQRSPLLLVVGSQEVYGQIQPEELPITETTPFRPVNPYAVSKAAVDLLAYQYHVSHQLRTVRLRPFNHIGPRQTERFVVSAFAAQIARIEAGLQPPIMRVGNLSAERDFTDVRDVVSAYRVAITGSVPGAAYNIGSGRAVSIQTILDLLLRQSRVSISVEQDPARMRPADVPRVVCNAERFRSATGWVPQYSLEQTLTDVLNYWREVVARST